MANTLRGKSLGYYRYYSNNNVFDKHADQTSMPIKNPASYIITV
jgi:hypothetical protein